MRDFPYREKINGQREGETNPATMVINFIIKLWKKTSPAENRNNDLLFPATKPRRLGSKEEICICNEMTVKTSKCNLVVSTTLNPFPNDKFQTLPN